MLASQLRRLPISTPRSTSHKAPSNLPLTLLVNTPRHNPSPSRYPLQGPNSCLLHLPQPPPPPANRLPLLSSQHPRNLGRHRLLQGLRPRRPGPGHPLWLFLGDPGARDALRWRASSDRAFLRHGFSLRNNSLLVPASGLYFIYSQVVFAGPGCCPAAAPLHLAHEVQLSSAQYPAHVPLLSAQKSVRPGPQGPWVRSVYQGAVFLLTQGDQLSTSTDGIDHLLLGPSTVFFGAFAL